MTLADLAHIALVGIGATLLIDIWGMTLKRAFGLSSLDYCMLGRWILHMPRGVFAHESINRAAPRRHECAAGWAAHYSIGIAFALLFVWVARDGWLARPTLLPALAFGVATVVVPFFSLQPAFGLGIAASKTPNPGVARVKSLMTHAVFGLGLFLWALVLR